MGSMCNRHVSRCLLQLTVLLLQLKTMNPKCFLFQIAFSASSISKGLTGLDLTTEETTCSHYKDHEGPDKE